MKVKDYKVTSLFNYLKERCRFKNYEKELLRCFSLTEQKAVLRNFYCNQTFTRDRLLARLIALKNKKEFGLKEIILGFKDFFVAAVAALLTLYFERYFSSDFKISDTDIKVFIGLLLSLFVFLILFSVVEKIKYTLNEIPLKEIFGFELKIIEAALIDGSEEIEFDTLMETVEKKLKVDKNLDYLF